jgi:hypothetical protein
VVLVLVFGLLTQRLTRMPLSPRTTAGPKPVASQSRPDLSALSDDELSQLATEVLLALKEKRTHADTASSLNQIELANEAPDPEKARSGIENARRLLPLARQLTVGWLSEHLKVKREARMIDSVRSVFLDWSLGASAEVRERNLKQIRIGPNYATLLTSDDEAVFLLGHELTHVAARTGRLKNLINSTTETVSAATRIQLNDEQKEELTCDFTGAEILKRFVAGNPTNESEAVRLSRTVGYEPPAQRLTRAWTDFCSSYNGDVGDHEHLSADQTVRSLVVLDPDLKALIPLDTNPTRLCP